MKSREDLVRLISGSFSAEHGAVLIAMIKPAVAVVEAGGVTSSWVTGSALLPAGAPWPSVDGRALMHTARIDLAAVPKVVEGQPGSGHLSFFDGYPWMEELGWVGPDAQRHASVIYTRDEPLVMQQCPLDPDEHESVSLDGPTYVEFAGPYYSIPSPEALIEQSTLSWGEQSHESFTQFSEALSELVDQSYTLGQLFGNVSPIQNHPTPRPWNLRNDKPPALDAWDHLATFRYGDGMFDFYFSVKHADFVDHSFANISFEPQCD